ncbi:hypothetical protein J2T09_003516 [Neorhizobium huautlense]|uniref:Transposase n=1 Tax=Neorhizobium huautlense TaxID=67774 RepID=A0ABT9PXZ8_9HYPH|nr:hypothetical protein [Neorhizobium huautlense]MDP9838744.1 hypothetical protein [Neorhizobium huautlense]
MLQNTQRGWKASATLGANDAPLALPAPEFDIKQVICVDSRYWRLFGACPIHLAREGLVETQVVAIFHRYDRQQSRVDGPIPFKPRVETQSND